MLNREIEKNQLGLVNYLRGKTQKEFLASVVTAYYAYLIEKFDLRQLFYDRIHFEYNQKFSLKEFYAQCIEEFVPNEAKCFVGELLDETSIEAIDYCLKWDVTALYEYILYAEDMSVDRGEYSTPQSISALASEILNIQSGETVFDSCSGVGSFLINAFKKQPNAQYYGVDINSWACGLATLRTSLLNSRVEIRQGNIFDWIIENTQFDKAFSAFPLGMRIKLLDGSCLLENYKKHIPILTKGTSADWLFTYRLLEMIKPTGRAVSIMSLGGLWNTLDKEIRKYFLQQKKIEAIINLPSKLLANTNIPIAMIVFGYGKDGIRFVDASNEFVEGRRQSTLSVENINHILKALNTDTEISRFVGYDEIAKQDYSFAANRYLAKQEIIKNGVKFSEVIRYIRRGVQISASELDNVVSSIPTDIQYIVPANIQNGVITKDLTSFISFNQRYMRYIVNDGDLLISKNGYPLKIAVAKVEEGKTLIASGNLYIIGLNATKVNPYYIKAFLESDLGNSVLKKIIVGSTIPSFGATQLSEIEIPLIPLKKQNELAVKYLVAMDNIEYLKRQVEKAKNELVEIISSMFIGEDK